jgi:phosphohistidine swiveling domain-containing protein
MQITKEVANTLKYQERKTEIHTMNQEFPETLTELGEELEIHAKDGRDDDLFRFPIFVSQIGSLASHLTHDQVLNPTSRVYGTKDGEINDFGHAVVQLLTYGRLRNIPLQEAVNSALLHLRDRDFIKKTCDSPDEIKGLQASKFNETRGIAWVDPYCKHLVKMPEDRILVAIHPTNDISPFRHKLRAIINDEGGMTCHAAILARESEIPCIVGTVNATRLLRTGDEVIMKGNQVWKVVNQNADQS